MIWRLLIFAGVCVLLPAFADFLSPMALEMALAVDRREGFLMKPYVRHRELLWGVEAPRYR
jgi:hypothetical protein